MPKASVVQKKIEGLRDEKQYCRMCATLKPHSEFWDPKKRAYAKTCSRCLSSRRIKKRIRKGKKVYYPAYMQSTAWREKKSEYRKHGQYQECYLCGRPWFRGIELHHRTYERLGREELSDLVPVCPEHHVLITRAWKIVKGMGLVSLEEVTDGICESFRKKHGLPSRRAMESVAEPVRST